METFQLSPTHFPESTRDLLDVPTILNYGVLPLGFKKRMGWLGPSRQINLGTVDATRRERRRLKRELRPKLKAHGFRYLRLYQVRLPEFLVVLEKIYNIGERELRGREGSSLAPALNAFLARSGTPASALGRLI